MTIIRSRNEIERLLRQSPGLRGQLESFAEEVYPSARREAATDIGLKRTQWTVIPAKSQWTLEQLIDPDFFPQNESD